MATPLAILAAGGRPVFVDCRRDDLCLSFEDFEAKAERHRPRAAVLVHIGGHLAFESERIAAYCREHGIFLLEDCAHAHGASWDGRRPGTFGDAGAFSLYATKTISTGEGGVLVSGDRDLVAYARTWRDYGKPDFAVRGLGFRMSEFTAALGLVGVERLDDVVAWKNAVAREQLDPVHPGPARAARRDGVGPVQVRRVRPDPAVDRQGVRRALPPDHGHRRRPAEHGLGGERPLVRPAVLPPARGRRVMSAPVLVTGGAGFIGSHVVDRLLAAGRRPRILDVRPSPWHREDEVELVLGDIRRAEDVAAAMRGCGAVCHLAAAADVGEVQAEPAWATELNAMGTLNVLEAARTQGVERVVYASTVWVYSDVPGDVLDEDALLAPPAHLYTAGKLSGELFCRSYAELYGLGRPCCASASPTAPGPDRPRSSPASSGVRSTARR